MDITKTRQQELIKQRKDVCTGGLHLPFLYFVLCRPYPAHCSSAPAPTRRIRAADLYLTLSQVSSLPVSSSKQPSPLAANHRAIPIFRSWSNAWINWASWSWFKMTTVTENSYRYWFEKYHVGPCRIYQWHNMLCFRGQLQQISINLYKFPSATQFYDEQTSKRKEKYRKW